MKIAATIKKLRSNTPLYMILWPNAWFWYNNVLCNIDFHPKQLLADLRSEYGKTPEKMLKGMVEYLDERVGYTVYLSLKEAHDHACVEGDGHTYVAMTPKQVLDAFLEMEFISNEFTGQKPVNVV